MHMKLPIFYTVSMYRRKVTVKCVTLVLLWIKLWFHHESYGLKCSMFIKDEFKIGLLEQQEQKQDSKKQKKNTKKSCLLKKMNFMWKMKKYSRISLCWLVTHWCHFFIVNNLDVFVFSKMWSVFLLKKKKISETIVPNSKGTFFLELQCVSCVK